MPEGKRENFLGPLTEPGKFFPLTAEPRNARRWFRVLPAAALGIVRRPTFGAGHHHQIGLVPLTPPTCSTYRTILYNLYKINPPHLQTERVETKILTINKI
jgi:hypothetical protein